MALELAPLQQSVDASISMLNEIFGTNWWTMSPEVEGPSATIAKMLEQLNELSIFAVTFLFMITYIGAIVGTAHEGTPLGKKLHSFWVPVRFALSAGMLVPLKGGLCLFQLLLLATVGWSLHFANGLWDTFLEYGIEKNIPVSAFHQPLRMQSEKTVKDIFDNVVYLKYYADEHEIGIGDNIYDWVLEQQGRTSSANLGNIFSSAPKKATEDELLDVPFIWRMQFNDPLSNTGSAKDTGYVLLTCDSAQMCEQEKAALDKVVPTVFDLAEDIVGRAIDIEQKDIYIESLKQATDTLHKDLINIVDKRFADKIRELKNDGDAFIEHSRELGWIGAGSYYHTFMGFYKRASEIAQINISSSPGAIAVKGDGSQQFAEMARLTSTAYSLNNDSSLLKALDATKTGGVWGFLTSVWENGAVLTTSAMLTGGHDPIHTLGAYGNNLITVIASSFLALGALGGFTGTALYESMASKISEVFTFGGTSVGKHMIAGLKGVLDSLSPFLNLILIGLWAMGNVLAYYLPAVPFIIWVSGVLGWLILIIESLVAAPLWIVAHAMPEGDGLAGERGKQGYLLFLGILVRPFLMLMGMCIAITIIGAVGKLLGLLFVAYYGSATENIGGIQMPIHTQIAYICLLGSLLIVFCHKVFGLITYLPDNVLRWIGGHTPNLGEDQDEHKTNALVAGGVHRTEGALARGHHTASNKKQVDTAANKLKGNNAEAAEKATSAVAGIRTENDAMGGLKDMESTSDTGANTETPYPSNPLGQPSQSKGIKNYGDDL